jgi:2-dehydro-3-deoxygluconokinase
MPSFDDEATHFGDADVAATVTRYRSLGVENVVVKDGAKGVTLSFGGGASEFVPSAKVEKIVDTTSAGDSFNGAFLARYAADGDPVAAARFAAQTAAAVIQHHGALVARDKLEALF